MFLERQFLCDSAEEFDEWDEKEAEKEGDYEGFEGESGFDGGFGVNGCGGEDGCCLGGFPGSADGSGLSCVMGVVGSAVARGYFLAVAVGGEAGGVTSLVGLDCDGRGFTNGVVEGEGYSFYHGVVNAFIVSLLRHGLVASATRCRQGKRHYEGSR